MQKLKNKNIALVICGGIAAYKSLDLIRKLKEQQANVFVILTKSAQKFITPLSATALNHNKVYIDLFSENENDINHIELAKKLDLIIIAPATANKLAEFANGIANDFAGVLILAAICPILCAPAMNPNMFNKASVQRNIAILKQDNFNFIGPNIGAMAEKNSYGIGRMSEPIEIIEQACRILIPVSSKLANKKFIITAGATIEPIDPVRYISNYSSGKQAFAIARALRAKGAEIILIKGNTELPATDDIEIINAITAEKMFNEVHKQLPCYGAIFAAAICDWRVANIKMNKLKKPFKFENLEFIENPDILKSVTNSQNRPKLVIGFAAETENHIINATKKLNEKNADIILLNNVLNNEEEESAFGSDFNSITVIQKNNVPIKWERANKTEIAEKLVDFIEKKAIS